MDGDLSDADLHALASELLCNDTIEHFSLGPIPPQFGAETTASDRVESVPLAGLDDAALMQISRERLLSLDLAEMRTIQAEFERVGRPPTDVELETLAQTWSEHCVHKTFRAKIDFTHLDADGNGHQPRDRGRPAQPIHPRRHRKGGPRLAALGLCGRRRHHRL